MYGEEYAIALAKKCGAPILIPYVKWILQECCNKSIDRLFFISRDGFALKKIADVLIERENYKIQTKYIYGSRRIWRTAYFFKRDFSVIRFLDESYREKVVNAKKLASLFGLKEEEILSFLPDYYRVHSNSWRINDLFFIQNSLEKNVVFKKYLQERHKKTYERVKGYLHQEVDQLKDSDAFVESIGTGYTLSALRLFFDNHSINAFYFYQHNKKQNTTYFSFIKDTKENLLQIELLCRSCEGQTIDYCNKDGMYLPIFDNVETESLIEYGYNTYLEELVDCTLNFEWKQEKVSESISSFLELKHYDELNYIGDFPYGVVGVEKKLCKFAPKLSKEEENEIIRYGLRYVECNTYTGAMISHSIRRSSYWKRIIFKVLLSSKFWRRIQEKNLREKSCFSPDCYEQVFSCTKDSKIIIYGAGVVGTQLFEILSRIKTIQVTGWIDRNVRKYKKYNIKPPEEIVNLQYDFVIIAIINGAICQEVSEQLIENGVVEEKILNKGY